MDEKELDRAKSLAYRLLEYRSRSEKELAARLKLKKISGRVITRVISDLKRISLINDEEFARAWVRESLKWRLVSASALEA